MEGAGLGRAFCFLGVGVEKQVRPPSLRSGVGMTRLEWGLEFSTESGSFAQNKYFWIVTCDLY
jgi:hypothetical protein